MRRSQRKGKPFPDGEAALAWPLRVYMDEAVLHTIRYIRVDCRRSVEAISKNVVGKVAALLERGGRANAA